MAELSPTTPLVQVVLDCDQQWAQRARWACEALLMRVGVSQWSIVDAGDVSVASPGQRLAASRGQTVIRYSQDGDLLHKPSDWQLEHSVEPMNDPLARTFWWLARVEELDEAEDRFDEHGRFRFDAAAIGGYGRLETPVDDLAVKVFGHCADVQRAPLAVEGHHDASFFVIATHDVDLPWKWIRGERRRELRRMVRSVLSGRVRAALGSVTALISSVAAVVTKRDPWCNAERISSLEQAANASSTHFLLPPSNSSCEPEWWSPYDGPIDRQRYGRSRYAANLSPQQVGRHGSYASSDAPELIVQQRHGALDHRFHYLRHRPSSAWHDLAAAGYRSDSSLGFAEMPAFRAGTAWPFRAWSHKDDAPLDLIIVPLVLMDASFDSRYLGCTPQAADSWIDQSVEAVSDSHGAASILWHNDRLCHRGAQATTEQYERLLAQVESRGGSVVSVGEIATAFRAALTGAQAER